MVNINYLLNLLPIIGKVSSGTMGAPKVCAEIAAGLVPSIKGTGRYAYYQDPTTLPNLFDRRQTFLLKMNNLNAQEKILNSWSRKYN
jgi:hypothetical protein